MVKAIDETLNLEDEIPSSNGYFLPTFTANTPIAAPLSIVQAPVAAPPAAITPAKTYVPPVAPSAISQEDFSPFLNIAELRAFQAPVNTVQGALTSFSNTVPIGTTTSNAGALTQATTEEDLAEEVDLAALTPAQRTALRGTNQGLSDAQIAENQAKYAKVLDLKNQIMNSFDTTKWQGSGYGSADANARNMAEILDSVGITDINQLGKVKIQVPDVGWVGNSEDGGYQELGTTHTEEVWGNTSNGKPLPNTYGERQTGNFWGGTYAGEGNTGYGVFTDAQGKNHFYTVGASSNTLANMFADSPLLAAVANIVAASLGGPVGVAALAAAQGKSPEDIIKSAALSYLGGQVANTVTGAAGDVFNADAGSALGPDNIDIGGGFNPATSSAAFNADALTNAAAKVVGNAAGQVVSSGGKTDLATAIMTGGINAGVNAVTNQIPGYASLSPAAQTFVNSAVTSTIKNGGNLSAADIEKAAIAAGTSALQAAISSSAKSSATNTGDLGNRVYDDTIVQDGADAFAKAKAAGASDADAYAAANTVTGSATGAVSTPVTGGETSKPIITDVSKDIGEFSGVDKAVADQKAANTVAIGNAEADNPEEAAWLAKQRNPNATSYTFGGKEYTFLASNSTLNAVANANDLQDKIDSSKTFNEAFAAAREGLGAGKTFTWNGKQYSTSTFAENPALSGNVVPGGASTTAGAGRGSYAGYSSVEDAANKTKLSNDKTAELLKYITDTGGSAQYDALGNPIGGAQIAGSPDLSTTGGKIANGFANAANTFFGIVANTPNAAVQAGSNLLSNTAGIIDLAAGKSTDVGNILRDQSGKIDKFISSISDPEVQKQQQAIGKSIDDASGFLNKTAALAKSVVDNPLGSANWVFSEAFEEVPGVGLALKAGSKVAGYGILVANDMIESGGSAYNDTYKAAKDQGMSEVDARSAARNSALASMAVTGVTQGLIEGKMLNKAIGKETVGEGLEGGAQAAATQLALGQDLNPDAIIKAALLEAAIGKGASVTADAMTATNNAVSSATSKIDQVAASGDPTKTTAAVSDSIKSGIQSGADTGSVITASVVTALEHGADIKDTVDAAVSSALTKNASNAADVANSIAYSLTASGAGSDHTSTILTDALTSAGVSPSSVSKIVSTAISNAESKISSISKTSTGTTTTPAATATATSATTDAATKTDIDNAIKNIQFPAGITKADVTTAISDYVKANPGLSAADVSKAVSDQISKLPAAATAADVKNAVSAATKDFATKADIDNAIKNIQFPAGVTKADVTSAISTYMKANPGLTLADVSKNIADATKGLATTDSVKSSISDALKGYATTQNVTDLQNKLTAAIDSAVKTGQTGDAALQSAINKVASDLGTSSSNILSQLGKTQTQLQTQFSSQISGLDAKLTSAIQDAVKTGQTGDAALQTAINKVATDLGTTKSSLLSQMGKTEADLSKKIGDVQADLNQTEKDILAQVAANEKAGMTRDAALQTAISSVAASQKTDVATLTNKISGVQSALGQEIATQVSGLNTKLTAAIDSAIKAGQTGDAALQTAISKVSSDLGTTKTDLLNQLGKTQTQLQTQFSGQLSGLDTKLTAAIDNAIKAGQTGDAALQTAINKVASDLGTSSSNILSQLGKTQTQLQTQFSSQLSGLDAKLTSAINDAIKSGQTGDAALQTAISKVSSDLGTTKTDLLNQLGKTQTQLQTQFSSQLSGLDTKLSTAIDNAIKAGQTGDAALQTAINKVASDLGTSSSNILSQLGKTQTQLQTQFSSQLSGLDAKLTSAINDAVKAGQTGDAALQTAINKVSSDLGTTKTDLLSQLGKTQTQLQTQFSGQLSGVESKLTAAINDAIKAGQTGDAALQTAISKVSSDLGTTKTDLLSQLGKTQTQLQTQFSGQLSGLDAKLTTAIQDAVKAGQSGDAALQAAIGKVSSDLGTTKTDLLSQLGKTEAQLKSDMASKLNDVTVKIGGVETKISDVNNSLTQKINEAIQSGQSSDAAINSAIETVANNLNTTKTDLLTSLNTTTANIKNQIQQATTETQTKLQTEIDKVLQTTTDAKTATDAAIKTVADDLGITKDQLLTKLQTTEDKLVTKIDDQIKTVQDQIKKSQEQTKKDIAASQNAQKALQLATATYGAGALHQFMDPVFLKSQVTGGAVDPLAQFKQIQQEMERESMMQQIDPRLAAMLQQRSGQQDQQGLSQASETPYYSYGQEQSIDDILGGQAANYKAGGYVAPLMATGGMALPLLAKTGGALDQYAGRENFKHGKHVAGEGDGQSDDIPAWLADGEFVFPADVVSALGNGSTKAGTDKLYEMMHNIRDHARSTGPKDLPPPALKSPLDYLKSHKRSAK